MPSRWPSCKDRTWSRRATILPDPASRITATARFRACLPLRTPPYRSMAGHCRRNPSRQRHPGMPLRHGSRTAAFIGGHKYFHRCLRGATIRPRAELRRLFTRNSRQDTRSSLRCSNCTACANFQCKEARGGNSTWELLLWRGRFIRDLVQPAHARYPASSSPDVSEPARDDRTSGRKIANRPDRSPLRDERSKRNVKSSVHDHRLQPSVIPFVKNFAEHRHGMSQCCGCDARCSAYVRRLAR